MVNVPTEIKMDIKTICNVSPKNRIRNDIVKLSLRTKIKMRLSKAKKIISYYLLIL